MMKRKLILLPIVCALLLMISNNGYTQTPSIDYKSSKEYIIRKLSIVVQLSDPEDYEGGELYFPIQGIEFKPKARAAYFFPGDMNFIHGVRPVLSGCRYTSPFFWSILSHKDSNE